MKIFLGFCFLLLLTDSRVCTNLRPNFRTFWNVFLFNEVPGKYAAQVYYGLMFLCLVGIGVLAINQKTVD